LILGVKEELTDLQRRMKQIHCFISDAEQRSIRESAVNNWLGELRDAMYDADNIIDLARVKGNELLADHPSSPPRKSTIGGKPHPSLSPILWGRRLNILVGNWWTWCLHIRKVKLTSLPLLELVELVKQH